MKINNLKNFLIFLSENLCLIIENIFKKIIRNVILDLSKMTYDVIINSFRIRKDVYDVGLSCLSYVMISKKLNLQY